MGTELKQRLMSSLQSTIGSVYSLGWMSASETTAAVTAEMETTGDTRDGQQQQRRETEEPTGPVSRDAVAVGGDGCRATGGGFRDERSLRNWFVQ